MRDYKINDLRDSGVIDSNGNIVPNFILKKQNSTPSFQSVKSQLLLFEKLNGKQKLGLIGLDLQNEGKTNKNIIKLKIRDTNLKNNNQNYKSNKNDYINQVEHFKTQT